MTAPLTRHRILVTGGGSGIGRAVVQRYLDDGATVTVLERSREHGQTLQALAAPGLTVLTGDATDPRDLAQAVDAAVDGGDELHNLTTCVGIFDFGARVTELDQAELLRAGEEIWRLNVLSHLQAVRAAHQALRHGRGSITLTLSESAFYPTGGGVLYGSSKWAVRGMVAHLAAELAPEVRVNGVAPGGTVGTRFGGLAALQQTRRADTEAGREERIAHGTLLGLAPRAEDHAAAYSYLAHRDDARAVTGATINIDAGRRA